MTKPQYMPEIAVDACIAKRYSDLDDSVFQAPRRGKIFPDGIKGGHTTGTCKQAATSACRLACGNTTRGYVRPRLGLAPPQRKSGRTLVSEGKWELALDVSLRWTGRDTG